MPAEALDEAQGLQVTAEFLEREFPGIDRTGFVSTFEIIKVSNQLVQVVEREVFRPAGWSWAGWRIMFALYCRGPLLASHFSTLADVSRPSVSSALSTLERDGYIQRRKESQDRREVTVHLTEQGDDAVRRTFPDSVKVMNGVLGALSCEEVAVLEKLLAKISTTHGLF